MSRGAAVRPPQVPSRPVFRVVAWRCLGCAATFRPGLLFCPVCGCLTQLDAVEVMEDTMPRITVGDGASNADSTEDAAPADVTPEPEPLEDNAPPEVVSVPEQATDSPKPTGRRKTGN